MFNAFPLLHHNRVRPYKEGCTPQNYGPNNARTTAPPIKIIPHKKKTKIRFVS